MLRILKHIKGPLHPFVWSGWLIVAGVSNILFGAAMMRVSPVLGITGGIVLGGGLILLGAGAYGEYYYGFRPIARQHYRKLMRYGIILGAVGGVTVILWPVTLTIGKHFVIIGIVMLIIGVIGLGSGYSERS